MIKKVPDSKFYFERFCFQNAFLKEKGLQLSKIVLSINSQFNLHKKRYTPINGSHWYLTLIWNHYSEQLLS